MEIYSQYEFKDTRDLIAKQREWLDEAETHRGHMPDFILDQIAADLDCWASRTAAAVRFYRMRLLSRRENTRDDARQWLSLYESEAFALRDELVSMVDEVIGYCAELVDD